MKKFLAFALLSSLLTIAVIALADATVLDVAPRPESGVPARHAPLLEQLPATMV